VADTNDKVMALVTAELQKNPAATTEELQNAAKKKFPSAGKLSKRQFNARYALQIKRKLPAAKRTAATKAPAKKAPARKATTRKAPSRATATKAARRAAAAVAAATSRRATPAASGADRDAIRQQFLRFASDITAAEGRNDLVKVLANVDKYVDAVVKAAT
jgi:hypothetical protein